MSKKEEIKTVLVQRLDLNERAAEASGINADGRPGYPAADFARQVPQKKYFIPIHERKKKPRRTKTAPTTAS